MLTRARKTAPSWAQPHECHPENNLALDDSKRIRWSAALNPFAVKFLTESIRAPAPCGLAARKHTRSVAGRRIVLRQGFGTSQPNRDRALSWLQPWMSWMSRTLVTWKIWCCRMRERILPRTRSAAGSAAQSPGNRPWGTNCGSTSVLALLRRPVLGVPAHAGAAHGGGCGNYGPRRSSGYGAPGTVRTLPQ